jgi:hypothetical protein
MIFMSKKNSVIPSQITDLINVSIFILLKIRSAKTVDSSFKKFPRFKRKQSGLLCLIIF